MPFADHFRAGNFEGQGGVGPAQSIAGVAYVTWRFFFLEKPNNDNNNNNAEVLINGLSAHFVGESVFARVCVVLGLEGSSPIKQPGQERMCGSNGRNEWGLGAGLIIQPCVQLSSEFFNTTLIHRRNSQWGGELRAEAPATACAKE